MCLAACFDRCKRKSAKVWQSREIALFGHPPFAKVKPSTMKGIEQHVLSTLGTPSTSAAKLACRGKYFGTGMQGTLVVWNERNQNLQNFLWWTRLGAESWKSCDVSRFVDAGADAKLYNAWPSYETVWEHVWLLPLAPGDFLGFFCLAEGFLKQFTGVIFETFIFPEVYPVLLFFWDRTALDPLCIPGATSHYQNLLELGGFGCCCHNWFFFCMFWHTFGKSGNRIKILVSGQNIFLHEPSHIIQLCTWPSFNLSTHQPA